MPKRSSKRRHSGSDSGAELEVTKRSVGTSLAWTAWPVPSSMLMVVGLPAATVTPWARISSKKRVAENRFLITSVALQHEDPGLRNTWADAQLKERKSYMGSAADMPKPSAVGTRLPI